MRTSPTDCLIAAALAMTVLCSGGCDRGPQQPQHRTNTVRLHTAAALVGGLVSDAALWEIEPTQEADDCFIAFFEEGPEGVRCLGTGIEIESGEDHRHYAGFVILKDEPRGEEPPTVRLVTASDGPRGVLKAGRVTARSWAFFSAANSTTASGVRVALSSDEATRVADVTYAACEATPEGCRGTDDESLSGDQVRRTLYLALVGDDPPQPFEWCDELPDGVRVVPRNEVR